MYLRVYANQAFIVAIVSCNLSSTSEAIVNYALNNLLPDSVHNCRFGEQHPLRFKLSIEPQDSRTDGSRLPCQRVHDLLLQVL